MVDGRSGCITLPKPKRIRLRTRLSGSGENLLLKTKKTWHLDGDDEWIIDMITKQGTTFYAGDLLEIDGKRCYIYKETESGLKWIRGFDLLAEKYEV